MLVNNVYLGSENICSLYQGEPYIRVCMWGDILRVLLSICRFYTTLTALQSTCLNFQRFLAS